MTPYPAYILVIQQVLAGAPTDLIYPVDGFGPLNLQRCHEWRIRFVERAERFGDEIIRAECLLGGNND